MARSHGIELQFDTELGDEYKWLFVRPALLKLHHILGCGLKQLVNSLIKAFLESK